MKWIGEVVAVTCESWVHGRFVVTLAGAQGHGGAFEVPIPARAIGAYAIGRQVEIVVTPR